MRRSSILNQYRGICSDVVNEFAAKLNKSFKSFIIETLLLYMVIPRKINFLQMGRYSYSCEQRFRQNFARDFDWLSFNLSLSQQILTGERKAIAIDPSYISKSGKSTPWTGYFSKKTFADGLLEQEFHLISRFRDDAILRYPTLEKPTGKKGRPKLFDGMIDFRNTKQFTGLNHSQARSTAKLRFNFNASLTSVNIAKVLAKERGIPFSMA